MKKILCAVDFSSSTQDVVDAAAKLGRAVDGRIVLVAVVQALPPGVALDMAMVDLSELTLRAEKEADRQLAELKKRITFDAIDLETRRLTGSPVDKILEQAAVLPAEYIVMGSHGHTAIYDLLIGSTAQAVIKRSPCPVLVVPQRKEQAAKSDASKNGSVAAARAMTHS
jgi:nucleotide-binding universal stress UspA family protein